MRCFPLSVLSVIFFWTTSVFAQVPYFLASAGWSRADTNVHDLLMWRACAHRIPSDVREKASVNSHKDAFALKLIGGYKFSENFALEGGYYYLGKHDCDLYGTTTTGTGKKQYTGAVNSSMVGHLIGIDAVGICPLFDSGHSLFAKVGVGVSWSQLKEDVHYQVNGTNPISTKRSHNVVNVVPKFGVGYEWGFTERLSMRIEYEYLCRAGYYKDFKNNYHFVTLGMKFGF